MLKVYYDHPEEFLEDLATNDFPTSGRTVLRISERQGRFVSGEGEPVTVHAGYILDDTLFCLVYDCGYDTGSETPANRKTRAKAKTAIDLIREAAREGNMEVRGGVFQLS